MRVLVKEVNWLGDLVISLPALAALHRAWPQAQLAVQVRRELAGFFDGFDWIEALPYDFGAGVRGFVDRLRYASRLRARGFDLAVLFPRSFDAALVPALARIPRRVGWRSDGRRLLLTDPVEPPRREGHQSLEYFDLLRRGLGIDAEAPGIALPVAERHLTAVREWLTRRRPHPSKPLIAMAVAAAYGPAKEWPGARYAALIDLLTDLGAECVLIGAANERGRCEAVAARSRAGALVAAGDVDLGETIALLSLCQGFAGNDSGAMHVAGALGIPTVGLFGSTSPDRTAPLGPRTHVIYHKVECSPCLQRTCRYGHYDCLHRIEAAEVVEALRSLGAL